MKSKKVKTIAAAVIIIVCWQLAAMTAKMGGEHSATLVPTWGVVLRESLPGFAVFRNGAEANYADAVIVLIWNTLITIRRVLLGLVCGGVLGILTGIAIGLNRNIRAMFYPIVKVLRNIPLLALIGLFLVWFGGSELGIVIYITFGLWIIYSTDVIEAIDGADQVKINFAKTLGASDRTVYMEVLLPMIVPNILDATKVALGCAWAVALGGEFLAAQSGLGRLLITSEHYMETGRMLIILVLFIVLTNVFDWLVTIIGKRLTSWMPR